MNVPSDPVDRRIFLLGAGTALTTALTGCSTNDGTSQDSPTQTTPNDTFHSPTETTTATKTPEDVATHTNTPETTTEETTTPVDETSTPEEWEDLNGEEIYENNLPPSDTKIDTDNNGEMTLQEFTEHVTDKYDLFTDEGLEQLKNIGNAIVDVGDHSQLRESGHGNHHAYIALEHIIHSEYDTDEARVFNDVTRPRQGKFLDATVQIEDQLYRFAPHPAKPTIEKLSESPPWDVNNNAKGNDIDYQNWRNWINREGGSFEDVENDPEGHTGIETSLSYDNSTGWLLPTEDFHAMAGAIHHYAAGQEDVETTRFEDMQPEDFDVEDVVRFRDEVNDLKQEYEHELGEDERILMHADYQDGDFSLEAELTSDWEISRGPYVEPPE